MIKNQNRSVSKNCRLFQGLTADEVNEVYEQTLPVIKNFYKNDTVIAQGSPVAKIGVIKKGSLLGIRYHENGESQVVRTFRPGDVICLDTLYSKLKCSSISLSCQADCQIVFISFSKLFSKNLINPIIREKILQNVAVILSDEHIRLMSKIDVLSKRTLQERILTYLTIIKEKRGYETFDIYMNQEQFAQYLCVNRSVLSKELNLMRKEAVIDYDGSCYTILSDK